jgi:hypothetical protein
LCLDQQSKRLHDLVLSLSLSLFWSRCRLMDTSHVFHVCFCKAGCTLDVIQFLFWVLLTFYLMLHNWIIVLESSVEHVILYLTD